MVFNISMWRNGRSLWRHNQEDHDLKIHRRENSKSCSENVWICCYSREQFKTISTVLTGSIRWEAGTEPQHKAIPTGKRS